MRHEPDLKVQMNKNRRYIHTALLAGAGGKYSAIWRGSREKAHGDGGNTRERKRAREEARGDEGNVATREASRTRASNTRSIWPSLSLRTFMNDIY